jgi:NAD+ synthase
MSSIKMNTKKSKQILIEFIKEHTKKLGFKKVVLGLSGGLDSTIVAFLLTQALGKENVFALIMPYKESDPESTKDAKRVAALLGIKFEIVDITPMLDTYYRLHPDKNRVRRGNKMARERMSVLYDFSHRKNALVVGTSNKSEILLGYGTLFGDLACAFNPIGSLYKTQLRWLAKELGVPQKIMDKKPSADLWKGQTDEKDMGLIYEEVDRFFYYWYDKRYSFKKLQKLGFKKNFIEKVVHKVKANEFKRKPPVIFSIPPQKINFGYIEK